MTVVIGMKWIVVVLPKFMRAVIQRVSQASVLVENKIIGEIKSGLLVLLAVHQDDGEEKLNKMADKVVNLRIFSDSEDKMNRSVIDEKGEILIVSQFTLYGDTKKGNRPSFITSAKPDKAIPMYEKFVSILKEKGIKVATGEFGAMMQVKLTNDGPVTIIIDL